jgi:hypothetical protein
MALLKYREVEFAGKDNCRQKIKMTENRRKSVTWGLDAVLFPVARGQKKWPIYLVFPGPKAVLRQTGSDIAGGPASGNYPGAARRRLAGHPHVTSCRSTFDTSRFRTRSPCQGPHGFVNHLLHDMRRHLCRGQAWNGVSTVCALLRMCTWCMHVHTPCMHPKDLCMQGAYAVYAPFCGKIPPAYACACTCIHLVGIRRKLHTREMSAEHVVRRWMTSSAGRQVIR